jgi:O-antigen ligase
MRRVVRVLLLAFVFAVPWEYSLDLGEPFGNIARITGLILLAAAIPAILLSGRLRTPGPLQWMVLMLFLWCCCTCFWSLDPQATLTRLRSYFQGMMAAGLIWEFAESPQDVRDLLRAYVAGSWILALLTMANFVSPDAATQVRFVADGQDPNDVARFLDLGFPMAALLLDWESSQGWKLLALGYLPLALVGVLLTASRGGFVAVLVALAGCGLLLRARHVRTVLAGLSSLPAIAAGFWFLVPHETLARLSTIPQQLQSGDLNQRLNIWTSGWKAVVHAPFLGSGAGTFVEAARLAPGDTAHNTGLAVMVEGGIVALILASVLLAVCVGSIVATRGPLRTALATLFLVWMVTSMVASVEANRTTWVLFGLIALAGRIESEAPGLMENCFPGVDAQRLREPEVEVA